MSGRYPPPEIRFWRNVSFRPSGCWEWQASTTGKYGTLYVNGRAVLAHRFAYERTMEDVPRGLDVMHICDNPLCVRVAHLRVGTRKDNVADMISKGRMNFVRADAFRSATHCIHGHEFTPENTYRYTYGNSTQRHCKQCLRRRERVYRAAARQTPGGVK